MVMTVVESQQGVSCRPLPYLKIECINQVPLVVALEINASIICLSEEIMNISPLLLRWLLQSIYAFVA